MAGKLTQSQINDFNQNGFLILDNVIDMPLRAALKEEYAALVDEIAGSRGHANSNWHSLNFEQKFTCLMAKDPESYEFLDISLPLRPGLDTNAGVHTGAAVFSLLTNPDILDIVESVIGGEIYSNPVQHVRIKPPESVLGAVGRGNSNISRTGWHQDAAVIVEDADNAPILTVWVAITDATKDMGCMRAVAGSHKWDKLGMHCPGRNGVGEIFIPQQKVNQHEVTDLEISAGGLILLHKKTWHGAGSNQSDRVRWSFDLRYQPPGYATGRDCFPGFMARSRSKPSQVLSDAAHWQRLWHSARDEIARGQRKAVFNERWEQYRTNPLCA